MGGRTGTLGEHLEGAPGGHLESVQALLEGIWKAHRPAWRALGRRTGALRVHLEGAQTHLEGTWWALLEIRDISSEDLLEALGGQLQATSALRMEST